MSDQDRQSVLRQLIRGDSRPRDLVQRLRCFGWDSERELVSLTRSDASTALRKFEAGDLTADELEEWADAIEGRDDIGFEPQAASLLGELLFELANPAINGTLTRAAAAAWIDRLGGAEGER